MFVFPFSESGELPDVPFLHLSFVISYVMKSDLLFCRKIENYENPKTTKSRLELYGAEIMDRFYTELIGLDDEDKKRQTEKKGGKTLVTLLDTMVINNRQDQRKHFKDLLVCRDKKNTEFTKLTPVDPSLWKPALTRNGFVKQLVIDLPDSCLAFECEWPKAAEEWFERKRMSEFPTKELIEKVRHTGIRLVPESPANVPESDRDAYWKYFFQPAEDIISENAVNDAQLVCFSATKLILDIVEVDTVIPLTVLKHAFFYMCEEIETSLWTSNPGKCVSDFIGRLYKNICDKNFPNYFIRTTNMFHASVQQTDITHCAKRLLVARRHPFVCLYLAVAPCLAKHSSLAMMFDDVVSDVPLYMEDRNNMATMKRCFLRLAGLSTEDAVVDGDYSRAYTKCLQFMSEFNNWLGESAFQRNQDLLQILSYLSAQDRWILAFYIDMSEGTQFMDVVNTEAVQTGDISDIFGLELKKTLQSFQPMLKEIKMPVYLLHVENVYSTANAVLSILKDLKLPPILLNSAIRYFLDKFSPKLEQLVADPKVSVFTKHKAIKESRAILMDSIIICGKQALENRQKMLSQVKDMIENYRKLMYEGQVKTASSLYRHILRLLSDVGN